MNLSGNLLNYVWLGIGIFALLYLVLIFNNLVTLKNNVKKSWANIDVLLKQRHDELPKLVETCKQYMAYERPTLEKITELRAKAMQAREQGDINTLGKVEGLLKGSLGNLFALAENYPELKANQTFAHLQTRISGLENSIADRRELYNDSVTLNNIRIEQIPDILVAKLFGFKHFVPLEYSASETADVDVNQLFSK
ncbi:LemA family protein [Candidatus Berkiella aquae]|uniref:LemA family protein n=1 Tax=Candidatus Berkiella aquae TaxID=295108 RepID=A0A0Q9YWK5_9GAMM|nr:LemA family protein [Candidatus Berkiella aquae]MCS5710900.1 LemA family protein [Candidatus Berkiella aquae]